MASRTVEILESKGELSVKEFYCYDCEYYTLSDYWSTKMICPRCDALLECNEEFIIKTIYSVDQNKNYPQ